MSENLINLAVTQFSATLEMKIQQLTSALRGRVAEGTHKGKQASPVNYMGPVKFQIPQGRFSPLVAQSANFERRWVFPKDRDLPQLVDTFDELRLISDPKSQYVANTTAAAAREWDDQIIVAATADAKTGTDVDALGTETFDTSIYRIADTFGASAATGLTVAKLKELKRKFRHYGQDGNSDNEVQTVVIGSQQESDLLGETEVTSLDYNSRPVLVDGNISRFMGFNFIVMERLPTYTTSTRGVLAFMKSGLYLGIWSDLANAVDRRTDLSSQPWQLYSKLTCGATRLQAGKLIQIACLDTTGASIIP
jgi:hypothetical protein